MVTPEALQPGIDAIVAKFNQGRSFVRPRYSFSLLKQTLASIYVFLSFVFNQWHGGLCESVQRSGNQGGGGRPQQGGQRLGRPPLRLKEEKFSLLS